MVKVRSILVFMIVAMVLVTMAAPVSAGNGSQNKSTDKQKYIVVFKDQGKDKKNKEWTLDDPLPGEVKYKYKILNAQAIELTVDQLAKVKARKDVKYIEQDTQAYADLDDVVPATNTTIVWRLGYTGRGVNVSVIDSGIDATHPDLIGKVILWKDFLDNAPEPYDDWGHGTHVANIIAGSGNASGGRYTGVAPGASLFGAKILNSSGIAYISDVIAAIDWSVENHADVISISLSSNVHVQALDDAVCNATMDGVVIVCSAGNTGPLPGSIKCPSDAPDAITVGSCNMYGNVSSFSSRGPTFDGRIKPDLVTYGENIVSARAVGTSLGTPISQYYTVLTGTSMACPQVSAACALLLEANREMTPADLKNVLLSSAKRSNTAYPNNYSGWGILDVGSALNLALTRNVTNIVIAKFTANRTSGIAPLSVQFTDNSTGATSWAWDFEADGVNDTTTRSPVHTYTVPGLYTVKLYAINGNVTDDETREAYINVIDASALPVANFFATPASGYAPLSVQFTDTSTGATNWTWDFNGDGASESSARNVTYTYELPGTYTVRLSVTNDYGADEEVKAGLITVNSSMPPEANFTANIRSGIAPLTVQFMDASKYAESWQWDFNGDGVIDSSAKDPSYTYNATGTYTVKLNATNAFGTDGETKDAYIVVTPPSAWKTYVSNYGGSSVSVISQNNDAVTKTITTGLGPFGIAYSPDGTRAYVAVDGLNKVSVISTATDTVVNNISVGRNPHGAVMSPDGSRLYVGNFGSGTVSVINTSDTNNYRVINTITGLSKPHELWISPDGNRLYVSTYQANNVYVINVDNDANTIVSTITGNKPYFISLDPAGTRLFVANYNSSNIQVYDTLSLTLQATINTTTGPLSPIISPDGSRLYYVTDGDNKLTIAYATNYTVVKTVTCGSGVRGIACSPDGSKVYVTNMNSGTTSIVNVTNDAGTVKTVRVGSYPYGLGQFAGYYPVPS